MKAIESPDDFSTRIKDCNNILIGNGFCLSHPIFRDAFVWDFNAAIQNQWNNLFSKEFISNSPEGSLSALRISIIKQIIKYYVTNLFKKIREIEKLDDEEVNVDLKSLYRCYKKIRDNKYSCNALLSGRENIFTLNYDPIIYFEFLCRCEPINKIKSFYDGFVLDENAKEKNGFLKQEDIGCVLEKKIASGRTRILYLHGSWFIVVNKDYELKKLTFGNTSSYSKDNLFEEGDPFLILEDRWRVKNALVEDIVYFKCCKDQLEKIKGSLLIFGCAFEKDDHILKALKRNESLDTILITYFDDQECNKLKNKIKNIGFDKEKIEWIKVGDNVIWAPPCGKSLQQC